MHISKLFSDVYKAFLKSIHKTNPYPTIKYNTHTHFQTGSPFSSTPVKSTQLGHTDIVNHSITVSGHQIKEKEWTEK